MDDSDVKAVGKGVAIGFEPFTNAEVTMKTIGKLLAVVAIGVASFFALASTASAAPCPASHGQAPGPDVVAAGHPWHG
jgi:hypothetical protein